MTELPHLFVRATVEFQDATTCVGVAADGLPPKWFTKNPQTRFEDDDLPQMRRVIRHAAEIAIASPAQPNLFSWWWQLYQSQHAWARESSIPPLLAGFGVSLIERAVMDAACRASGLTLFHALRTNAFEIDLGMVRRSLESVQPADFLPPTVADSVQLRHTVGLGDPLTDEEIDQADELDDGLPYSLVANIRQYGLQFFKIKVQGDVAEDRDRLARLAKIISEVAGPKARFTLDGNEQYDSVDEFRSDWDRWRSSPAVREFLDAGLLFVEQPLHRDHALNDEVQGSLRAWKNAPPIIIDESDADLDCLPTALRLGYAGTSHKNCKGIIKGLVCAATIAKQRDSNPDALMSAEDLANVGPVALLQDLAMVGALGIEHVERNGHHYFAGLSMFPERTQQQVLHRHPDLYRQHERGFATLSPRNGRLSLRSVREAPFGVSDVPDMSSFDVWEL